ncbi:MAG TPA: hypothetical protein VNW54_12240 [Granulicella sp.]|nr:hypothetical protein [Granulicella sp.]
MAWVTLLMLSLRYGLLSSFFYDQTHGRSNPGIDFFQIGRAFENLLDGRSVFDTFAGKPYGPYATWYVYHPALALALGPWLSPFGPWMAFRVWTAVSFALMCASAWLIMRRGSDPVRKPLVCLLMLGSFPLVVMLGAGNVQAILVLALTLVLVSVDEMREIGSTARNQGMLLAGLLISLFSKPAVFLMLPLLLCLRETRRAALKALGIYVVVSTLFLVVPGLNPEPMSWADRWNLATHPAIVRQTMDVYSNGFTVTQSMKDNSIHWLEMLAMTDTRLQNVDVYSLPVFLDGWLENARTPDAWYRIPGILVLEMSLLVLTLKNRDDRIEAALMVLMAASLMFFLSFGIVWEYSYTTVFPIAGILLMRTRVTRAAWAICGLTALVWGPSLFFMTKEAGRSLNSLMTWMRADRVLPVAAIFCILLGTAGVAVYRQWEPLLVGLMQPKTARRN